MKDLTLVRVSLLSVVHENQEDVLLQLPAEALDRSGAWTDLIWIPLESISCISYPMAANGNIGFVEVERWVIDEAFPDCAEALIDT